MLVANSGVISSATYRKDIYQVPSHARITIEVDSNISTHPLKIPWVTIIAQPIYCNHIIYLDLQQYCYQSNIYQFL